MSNSINTGTDINGLSANTTYTYYLYPINSNGQSAGYTQLQFTTLPTITSASLMSIDTSNQITLKWSGSYNTVKVYYSTNNTNYTQYGTSYNSATTSVSISPLSTNQFYYFKVEPYNSNLVAGTTTYITELSAVTLGHITTVSYSSLDASSVTLSWSGTYSTVDISYSSSLYTKSIAINNSTTLTAKITDLSSNTLHTFRVYPYNSFGYRGLPYTITATTLSNITYVDGLYFVIKAGYFSDNISTAESASNWTGTTTPYGYTYNLTNISTGTNSKISVNGADNYTVIWYGKFYTGSYSGSFTFYTNSDDASYLWLGSTADSGYTTSNPLVNNSGLHGMQERSGSITLSANTYYSIRIIFGENNGGDDCQVSFTLPGTSTRIYNGQGYYYSVST